MYPAPFTRVFRRLSVSRSARVPKERSDFTGVNARAGIVPVQPELSGLRTRVPQSTYRRSMQSLVAIAYRWNPSREYRQRQVEMRGVNRRSEELPVTLPVAPPILLFAEEGDVAPMRLQPLRGGNDEERGALLPVGETARDLRDLEEAARLHAPRMLQPRVPELEGDVFMGYRPLLPRQYREFLRTSPYPRVAAGLAVAGIAMAGVSWTLQIQQAGALASGRMRDAHRAFASTLQAAMAYGIDPGALRRLERQARSLSAAPSPIGIIPTRTQVHYFAGQATAYGALTQHVHDLEHRAMEYWTWREGQQFVSLTNAAQSAGSVALAVRAPTIPACDTPACFRVAVIRQMRYEAWLRQTTTTLRVYGAAIATGADPIAMAMNEIDRLHRVAHRQAFPVPLPVPLDRISRALSSAHDAAAFAQVGALAHLDADALLAQRHAHPSRP